MDTQIILQQNTAHTFPISFQPPSNPLSSIICNPTNELYTCYHIVSTRWRLCHTYTVFSQYLALTKKVGVVAC
jgi:hypothetical protein